MNRKTPEQKAATADIRQKKRNAATKLMYASQPELCGARSRSSHYKKKYGITVQQYDVMFDEQKGLCAICLKKDANRLCVDHDHATNKVRQLLCKPCNRLLGDSRENEVVLQSAIDYVRRHKT